MLLGLIPTKAASVDTDKVFFVECTIDQTSGPNPRPPKNMGLCVLANELWCIFPE